MRKSTSGQSSVMDEIDAIGAMADDPSPEQDFDASEEEVDGLPHVAEEMTDEDMELVHASSVEVRKPIYYTPDTNVGHRKIPPPDWCVKQKHFTVFTKPHPQGRRDYHRLQINNVVMLLPTGAMAEVCQSFYECLIQAGLTQPLRAQDFRMAPRVDRRVKAAHEFQELREFSRP